MANVTDSALLSAAQDIVTEFLDKKCSLNEGVIKKASDLGFNTEQTKRLIERTNTEAFLRIYPNDTEFDVASPEVILGIKTASAPVIKEASYEVYEDDGLFKAASVKKEAIKKSNYFDRYTDEDIFGMDNEFFKTASINTYPDAIDRESQAFLIGICQATKTASEIAQENLIKEEKFDEAMNSFGDLVKQSSVQYNIPLGKMEYDLLNKFPNEEALIGSTFDALSVKLASEMVDPKLLTRSSAVTTYKYASETPLTYEFRKVIEATKGLM